MYVIVLGSGAGGGVPQWNALNSASSSAFAGKSPQRSQCSVAFSANGRDWGLINASPDLRSQIIATPALHPQTGPRSTPIRSVILTGAEIDQITGLLTLRERQAFEIHATSNVLAAIAANPVFQVLNHALVARHARNPGENFTPLPGISASLLPLPGKVPLWAEAGLADPAAHRDGWCVAVILESAGKRAMVVPGCAAPTNDLMQLAQTADILLFEGTLFTDDEMIRSGEGAKTSFRMGHMPMTGSGGTLEAFAGCGARLKRFIHVNNTNPALDASSPARQTLRDAGWEIASDGEVFVL
ncbi:MAG TPA: pyrroloquinoline quinone biosynthesis protein PqqB [Micropepsaceae bacterium]|nr:pyrroloquinoline quinone biosynthesis protein PqqB [Micropepsaceae bacterium]